MQFSDIKSLPGCVDRLSLHSFKHLAHFIVGLVVIRKFTVSVYHSSLQLIVAPSILNLESDKRETDDLELTKAVTLQSASTTTTL